ncbi:MAG: glycosyltransferase [Anaerolineales bacterium]|nr:glycosyltransferase [Anaerolineales bacterium]
MLGTAFDLRIVANKLLLLAAVLIVLVVFALLVRRRRSLIRYFIGLAILLQVIYMTWRVLYTVPTFNAVSLFFGLLLFLAEFAALLQSTTHRLMFMKDHTQQVKTLADLEELPIVDILIATYNEPIKILRNTVAAAVSQDYPADRFTVYICDDGGREEVRRLAEECGAVWSIRENHNHAKAGNLNHCLRTHARGDLFVVLDADMIARSNFLERTVGYFCDPEMALVQAPQVFYNPDPFQNNLQLYGAIPNEQDFFMREVLTRRSAFNAVLNVGSNAVFRRSAIDAIGLIPVGTITEDMATSMLLQARGYKTIFVNETLAMGLSPDTFSDYVIQRDRWCRGNIQVMKKWNPLRLPGLSFMQRLIYFDGVLYWFFGLQKIIYYVGPMLFLLIGVPVYYANVFTMLLFFVPMYYSSSLIFTLFDHQNRTFSWAHIYESALAPYLSLSAVSELFFSQKSKFSVTPKGSAEESSHFALRVAVPHLILAGFSIWALAAGIQKMLTDVNYMIPVYLVNLFWLLYNLMGIMIAIIVCFEKQRVRTEERFLIEDSLMIQVEGEAPVPANIIDISFTSIAVEPQVVKTNPDSWVGKQARLVFHGFDLSLNAKVLRSRSWGKRIILMYNELTIKQHIALVKYIFSYQKAGFGAFTSSSTRTLVTLKDIIQKWWRVFVLKR